MLCEIKIRVFVPKVNNTLVLIELKEMGIEISNLRISEYEIDLLLGGDVIGNILTGSCDNLKEGLVGYTLMGKDVLRVIFVMMFLELYHRIP